MLVDVPYRKLRNRKGKKLNFFKILENTLKSPWFLWMMLTSQNFLEGIIAKYE